MKVHHTGRRRPCCIGSCEDTGADATGAGDPAAGRLWRVQAELSPGSINCPGGGGQIWTDRPVACRRGGRLMADSMIASTAAQALRRALALLRALPLADQGDPGRYHHQRCYRHRFPSRTRGAQLTYMATSCGATSTMRGHATNDWRGSLPRRDGGLRPSQREPARRNGPEERRSRVGRPMTDAASDSTAEPCWNLC